MDFTIGTDSLQRAIKVLGVVVRTNAVDATGRILIEVAENTVEISANNGATALIFNADQISISEYGVTSVAFNKIRAFVMSFKSWDGNSGAKKFRFVLDERITKVTVDNVYDDGNTSKGSLKIPNFNPAMVSKPSKFEQPDFVMHSSMFRTATNKVLYAINPQVDFSFTALQGMNMVFSKDNIHFVGCDGVVLSEYQVKNTTDKVEGTINLQYDFFMGLRRLINDHTQLFWELKGNRVSVKFDDIVFVGRTIVGHEYPDYKSALEEYTDHLNFSKEFLMATLAPFMDVLDPEDNFRLTIEIKDKTLKFYNDYANIETEQEDIQGGLNLSVDVNGKFLIQSIDAIRDDNILFKFSNGKGPLIFDSSTFNDQKALIKPLIKR
jgi:DNA polymerase III sliding clamp (beta) subunit (PCNA family)